MPANIQTDAYQITWLIRRLFRTMGQKVGEYLAELGVSAADRAVMEFLYPDQGLSVPAIAERYQVSRQHVQVTVNSLQALGLVETQPNPRHKRSPLILLNDNGRALFEQFMLKDRQAIDDLFTGISSADRKQTRQTLETLLSNLS